MCNTCGCDLNETDRHLLEGNGMHAQTGGGGAAVAVLLTKTDLLPFLGEFDPERVEANLRALANASPLQRLSVRNGEGLEDWLAWLEKRVALQRTRGAKARKRAPAGHPDGALLTGLV